MGAGREGLAFLLAERMFHPCKQVSSPTHGPAFAFGARTSSLSSNTKNPLFQISFRIDEASKELKNVSRRLLDAWVDTTFKFSDQVLAPSETNFAPVDENSEAIEIVQIEGEIPQDFPEGIYIRNGSNPLYGALHSTSSIFGQSREIWVEGEGMLHALYLTKKDSSGSWSISYANRYVQSETFRIERAHKKPCFLPAIQGNSSAIIAAYILNYLRFGKVNKDISNTNVFQHAGRVYAIAENHLPQEIFIGNLHTGDAWDIGGEWDRPFTAHPKVAPGSGELVIFGSDAKRPFLMIGVVSADGTKLKHKIDLKLERSTFCHDIGVTPQYNVIIDVPLTIDIRRLMMGGQLIEFEKQSYGRIGVMPRYGEAESVMWFDVKPFCMFHLINCFEEGDEVVVSGLRATHSIIPGPQHGLNKYERSENTGDGMSVKQGIQEDFFTRLYQWRLNLQTRAVSGKYLTGTKFSLEFPLINDYYIGHHHKYAYAQVVDSLSRYSGSTENGMAKEHPEFLYNCPTQKSKYNNQVLPKYGGFAKLCLEERENIATETSATNLIKAEFHWLGKDQFCSGAAFVPRVGASQEDDGWIISFTHDETTNTSQMRIIDTQRFEGAPVATITLPRRVPYGFHGAFFHSNQLTRCI